MFLRLPLLIVVFIGFFCSVQTEDESTRATSPIPCNNPSNDLVIIIDSSINIGPSFFTSCLNFTASLAEVWKTNPGNRVGVTTFSSIVQPRIPLQNGLTSSNIRAAIQSIPYVPGTTRTDLALSVTLQQMRAVFRGTLQNMLVLSDGRSDDPARTIAAATAVNGTPGMRAFSIGIGALINQGELDIIAGGISNRTFNARTPADLYNLLAPVSFYICRP